ALAVALAIGLFSYWTMSQEKPTNVEETAGPLLMRKPHLQRINGQQWIVLKDTVTQSTFIGLEDYPNANRLQLSNTRFDESDLRYIVKKDFIVLDLTATNVTDKGLETISEIKSLRSLILTDCGNITDKGMTYINRLPELSILSLEGTAITDDGIGRLSNLTNLILFYMPTSTKITDASLPIIWNQNKIRSVSVNDTAVSKSAVKKLFALPKISFLGLENLGITDSDIPEYLSESITMLELSRNPITDRTIEKAIPLKHLWYVDLTDCPRVSKPAIQKLKAAPHRRIVLSTDKPNLSDHYIEDTRWYFEPAVYDLLKNNPAALRTKVTEWQFPEEPFKD
ncbi:MAG: hypothetical protein K8F91_15370, partial [Candidatus Obscuribacterales bacterium]|nr:hypothetical protein [Candidatus Obscuribacterales bacterium]